MAEIKLTGQRQRDFAIEQITCAPDGYVVRIGKETRTQAQNRLMWPMLADLQKQVEGCHKQSTEAIKLRCMDALGQEMVYLPTLAGDGTFPVNKKSSTLTKAQFSLLIEVIFKFGAENSVTWSRGSQNGFEEMLR